MAKSSVLRSKRPEKVVSLVRDALELNQLSGLAVILKRLCDILQATGCILWQVRYGTDAPESPNKGYMIVFAEWFSGGKACYLDNLPIRRSLAGKAYLRGQCLNSKDIWTDKRVYKDHPFLREAGIQSMCAIPLAQNSGFYGTLSLYRDRREEFTRAEIAYAKELASVLLSLYETVRARVSLTLVQTASSIIHESEVATDDFSNTQELNDGVYSDICREAAKTFRCLEATVVLKDTSSEGEDYVVAASTWPYRKDLEGLKHVAGNKGLTNWSLKNARSVRIFDLLHFERDKKIIQATYPRITWRDSLNIESSYRRYIGAKEGHFLHPISCMCVPIVVNREVMGAIRCSTVLEAPYYFMNPELRVLETVSTQLAFFVQRTIARQKVTRENARWGILVNGVAKLNEFVAEQLDRSKPDRDQILSEGLKVMDSISDEPLASDVRLFDLDRQEQLLAAVRGKPWGSKKKPVGKGSLRIRMSSLTGSLEKDPQVVNQVLSIVCKNEPQQHGIKGQEDHTMLTTSIQIGSSAVGCVDVINPAQAGFDTLTRCAAELIARQFALYLTLASTVGELQEAKKSLEERMEWQTQAFEDLYHQLKTPVMQSRARAQALLIEGQTLDEYLITGLRAIRGLSTKATRVTNSIGVFAMLAQGDRIPLSVEHLLYSDIVQLLIEAASDNELLADPEKQLHFDVDRRSLRHFRTVGLEADRSLLAQAINNLLDNAGKYSYPRTVVEIYGGLTSARQLHISVSSKGLELKRNEVELCTQRGWRSKWATAATGEGTGIGLWIVDHIMEAHHGSLVVYPTNSKGITIFRLVFTKNGV